MFTRYPVPGKAKTRLIPAIGAEAAARLHQQMAEHTLSQAQQWRSTPSRTIEVWFTGGNLTEMQTWLGEDLHYQIQPEGDLGDRLVYGFQSAFDRAIESVVVIGTDCPQLDTAILNQAFLELQNADLVLGPAKDGGYYLIGLRQLYSELFANIPWSTADVLDSTTQQAANLGLTWFYLPVLADVDFPEDLAIWESVKSS